MSALNTIEAGFDQVSLVSKTRASRRSGPGLHLVTNSGEAITPPSCGSVTGVGAPSASPGRGHPAGPRVPAGRAIPGGQRGRPRRQEAVPLRLTQRGRLVVGVLAVLLATVAMTVIATAVAGRAQASNHGRDGAGYQGMHRIVVQPGETLWTIASQAEPSADPRQVIAEIMTGNSMTSTVVQAGELLWVPK